MKKLFDKLFNLIEQLDTDNENKIKSNDDLSLSFELQKERIKSKMLDYNIKIKRLDSVDDDNLFSNSFNSKTSNYKNHLISCVLEKNIKIKKDGRKLYAKTDKEILCAFVTDVKKDALFLDDIYNCPNCGYTAKISDLLEGCPYCRNKYVISDLYPKIENYYINYYGLGALGKGIAELVRMVVPLMEASASTEKLKSFFKSNNIDLSMVFFAGKAFNCLKTVIYSNNRNALPFYEGKEVNPMFDKIIDMYYRGVINCDKYEIKDNYIYLTISIYVNYLYIDGDKIYEKMGPIKATFQKNLNVLKNSTGFMKNIKCPSCGGSFDAFKQDNCPYCRSDYKYEDIDWIITEVKI